MSLKKNQSPPRKAASNAKNTKKRNPVKKISRTRNSKKKRPNTRASKDSRRTARIKPARKNPKARTSKNRIFRGSRETKSQKVTRLARNSRRRAAYRLKRGTKPHTTVKLAADTKYWLKRQSTTKATTRAAYTIKSIRSPRTKTSFHIRKKVKALNEEKLVNSLLKVEKGMKSFLKLKKKPKKRGKKAFIKLVVRDDQGNTRWLSSKREEFFDVYDIKGRLAAMEMLIKGYGNEFKIIGYEAEENI